MKKIYLSVLLLVFFNNLQAQTFEWAKQFGGLDTQYPYAVKVDAAGNVYTVGVFQSTTDFDPGPGTFNLTSVGFSDFFISKLDAAGNFVWVRVYSETQSTTSIGLDAAGNVFVTGSFTGTVDFDPGVTTFNLTSTGGSSDVFITKLDANGIFLFATSFGGTGADEAKAIEIDATGNIFTTGTFSGTADFDPGAATFNLISAGNRDVFISKLDAAGNFIWARGMGGAFTDISNSLALDVSGNVCITGNFLTTADFDPGAATFNLVSAGGTDAFVCKLNAAGDFVFAVKLGGTSNDNGQSIAVDATGNIYSTGEFRNTVDFDPGAGIFNLTSAGNSDVYVNKLSASGNFVWASRMGGGAQDTPAGIAVDAAGNAYSTGSFQTTADFDPGAATFNLVSAGQTDIYISKLNAAGNFAFAIKLGGTSFDGPFGITVDGSANIYTAGYFENTADFDPGAAIFNLISVDLEDAFIQKMSQTGAAGTSPTDYFRSITSGNWNTPATWESSPVADFSSGLISPATLAPGLNANTITIRGPHTINVTATVIAAKTIVNTGANLIVNGGVTLTVK